MREGKSLEYIYDDIIENFGKGVLTVHVGGVKHVVKLNLSNSRLIEICLDEKEFSRPFNVRRSLQIAARSVSLSREEKDYAKTILPYLDTNSTGHMTPAYLHYSLNTLIDMEYFLDRTFSSNVFKTLFKTITENDWKDPQYRLERNFHDVVLSKHRGNAQIWEPFLSIGKKETDKEILGRFLCGENFFIDRTKINSHSSMLIK